VSHLIKLWARRAKKNSNYGPKELGVEFTLRNETNSKFTSSFFDVEELTSDPFLQSKPRSRALYWLSRGLFTKGCDL
jgi:hypothetical protein